MPMRRHRRLLMTRVLASFPGFPLPLQGLLPLKFLKLLMHLVELAGLLLDALLVMLLRLAFVLAH